MRGIVLRIGVLAALAVSLLLPALAAAQAPALPHINVLSDRADLISGGDALISVTLPAHARLRQVRIWLNGRRVRHEFARRPNGLYEGVLTDMKLGPNTLVATLPDRQGARITIVNHPIGGPVFAGPQLEPWTCEAGATDAKCDKPAAISYLYEATGSNTLQPYDPASPPANVATTTTDQGVRVPFIVREELGYEDRDQYRIEILDQPGRPWSPWAPQAQWDHKLMIMHGFDCHTDYGVTTAPFGDGASSTPGSSSGAVTDSSVTALGMGFAVMSTALDDSAANCNPALQAESIVMAKEHMIDEFGPIAYTIGIGCSGGSIAELWMENAYPGLYQGLIPQCTFPDAGSTSQQIVDYEALDNYFAAATAADPLAWTPAQESEVDGTAIDNVPGEPVDATTSAAAFFPFTLPANCTDYANGLSPYITASQVYNPTTNPGGVRCGITDWEINLLGPQPKRVWDAQEKQIGHGFAGLPSDNVGVQYGLSALQSGEISPAQFVDVNAKIGGFNVDWVPTTSRLTGDEPALANAYRTGLINNANHLNTVPIIDLTGPNDPGLAHDTYRAFALRARLQRDFGTGANMVIWEGPTPLRGDVNYADQALVAMNHWLEAITADHSAKVLAAKVIADKPSDIHDQCSDGAGTVVSDTLCSRTVVPVYGTPRTVAGEPITTEQNKCQLVPLNRSAYAVAFTATQWTALQTVFPSGVCDYAKPGVGEQDTIAWMTYQTAAGKVIYGGRPMGALPTSQRCEVSATTRPSVCIPVPHFGRY